MAARAIVKPADVAALRARFVNGAANDPVRGQVWRELRGRAIVHPRALMDVHDLLLFVLAFPRSLAEHALAAAELDRIAALAERMVERNAAHRHALTNTGIAGTPTYAPFSIDLARWLIAEVPGEVELDSMDADDEVVRNLLLALALPTERDAMDDARHDAMDRIRTASGGDALRWLVEAIDRSTPDPLVRHALWGSCVPYVGVPRHRGQLSRTHCRGPSSDPHVHDRVSVTGDGIGRILRMPIEPARKLTAPERGQLIAAVRGILIGYLRETDTATLCDLGAIELFAMGRGIDIALMPLPPGRRSVFDAYVGFTAFSNGVPVAYGGAWIFPGKTKVGINVFPAFRGGPSAMIFAQVLRCYARRFNVGCFEADPYQLGDGNTDGIRSGAYWFYHRLGFRTADPALVAPVEEERGRIAADRSHRTPHALLRRFAAASMRLVLHAEEAPVFEPTDLSEAVLRSVARLHAGDRKRAGLAALERVRSALNVRSMAGWPTDERSAFADLAPAMAAIPDLGTWSAADRSLLVAIMRAKGRPTEDRYIALLRRHHRLLRAWAGLAGEAAAGQ